MPVAAVTTFATVGSAVAGSNAAKSAASASAKSSKNALALQREIYDQNNAALNPYMTRGNVAGDAYSSLLGLGGNPAASRQAFDTYRGATGYDFRMSEGLKAVNQNRATAGLLNSGSALRGLSDYAQGTASAEFGNYMSQLGNQQGVGLSAAGALAGVGTGYANSSSDIMQQNGANQANAALAGGQNLNALLGNLAGIGGYQLGQSSYGNPANPLGSRSSAGSHMGGYATPPINGWGRN